MFFIVLFQIISFDKKCYFATPSALGIFLRPSVGEVWIFSGTAYYYFFKGFCKSNSIYVGPVIFCDLLTQCIKMLTAKMCISLLLKGVILSRIAL